MIKLARPFVAPTQRYPNVDVVRCQFGAPLERKEGLAKTPQLPQCFAHQITCPRIAVNKLAAPLKCSQGVLSHTELKVAFGFFDDPLDEEVDTGHF